jgi:peroxiredoxin
LRDHHQQFVERGAVLLTIAPGGPGNSVDKYLDGKGGAFPFAVMSDAKHKVFDDYDVASKLLSLGQRPAMFIIDHDGKVRYNQVGTQQTNLPPIDEILAELDKLAT